MNKIIIISLTVISVVTLKFFGVSAHAARIIGGFDMESATIDGRVHIESALKDGPLILIDAQCLLDDGKTKTYLHTGKNGLPMIPKGASGTLHCTHTRTTGYESTINNHQGGDAILLKPFCYVGCVRN